LIRYSYSQISELCHIFKTSLSYLHIMILPCILVRVTHPRLKRQEWPERLMYVEPGYVSLQLDVRNSYK
jgi:hypothetical protein